jgi:hypothetical protein
MDDQTRQLLKRIKHSADGPEFLEYLRFLSLHNYAAFKRDAQEYNELHKGIALAYDQILEDFAGCEEADKAINPINIWR